METKILSLLTMHARPLILQEFREDSCIVSTRIALDVLDHFGIAAKPLPVHVTIYNPAVVERKELGYNLPETKEAMQEWVKEYKAWIIGLGFGGDKQPNKWPGHLVFTTKIQDNVYMADLSIDQANRPQWNIELSPFYTDVFPAFLDGEEDLFGKVNGCMLRYRVTPGNIGYTTSPNWLIRMQRNRVVREIVAKIQQELK